MTEETQTERPQCPECGFEELELNKTVENNEVREGGWYCPDCQSTFDEDVVLQWDSLDFPLWVEMESYNDTYGLLDRLCRQHSIHRAVVPNKRDMKYAVFSAWFKIDEDGAVEGPFDRRRGEKL